MYSRTITSAVYIPLPAFSSMPRANSQMSYWRRRCARRLRVASPESARLSLPYCSDQTRPPFVADLGNFQPSFSDSLAAPDPTPVVEDGKIHRSGCSGSPVAVVDHVAVRFPNSDCTAFSFNAANFHYIPDHTTQSAFRGCVVDSRKNLTCDDDIIIPQIPICWIYLG